MFLMTSLIAVCGNFVHLGGEQLLFQNKTSFCCGGLLTSHLRPRRKQVWHVPNASNGGGGGKGRELRSGKKTPWWKQFLFDDDEDDEWLSMEEDGLIDNEAIDEEEDGMAIEERKFETWRRRAEAISELRTAQEDARNGDRRNWEDWLENFSSSSSSNASPTSNSWDQNGGGGGDDDEDEDRYEMFPDTRLVKTAKDLVLRTYDDGLLFEDRVFKYASQNSAKFLGFLVIVPWIVDFVVHDFVAMPFLDRYVKTVPLAAEFFDVKKDQKLQMIKALKFEKARYQFEVEIGKSPPLSDEEVWVEMKHKAIEMRDEWRLENRNAFANILSDMVYGITLFLLVYFNQSRVALLKFTGYKLLNNITETGKAFLIILITDIFLGYHSASGWEALLETILERYGLEVDQAFTVTQVESLRHQAMNIVAARLSRAEPPLRKEAVEYMLDADSHMWSMRRSKANFFRIMSLLTGSIGVGKWFNDVCHWKNPITSVLVHVLFVILICYPELILPTLFLYMFLIGMWNYRFRPRHPAHMDTRMSWAEGVPLDELDEEFDTFPTTRPQHLVQMRYDRLRSVAGRIQTVVGDIATQGERLQSLLSWRDPRATFLFVCFCFAAAVVLYLTPFRIVTLLLGVILLRHPRFRSKVPCVPSNFFKRLPSKIDSML